MGYNDMLVRPVNGSSPTGHCADPWKASHVVICRNPNSSVLFDGNIPTLTGLDGDMWASQLLTLNTSVLLSVKEVYEDMRTHIEFGFDLKDVKLLRLEVVLFNCPDWGIATSTITFHSTNAYHPDYIRFKDIDPSLTSCDSLVRVCLPIQSDNDGVLLRFESPPGSNWAHLAEVTFYTDTSTCPPDTVLNHHPTPLLSTSTFLTPSSTAVVTTHSPSEYTDITSHMKDTSAPSVATTSGDNVPTPAGDNGFTSQGYTGSTPPEATDSTPPGDIGDPGPTPEAAQCEEVCPSPSSLATILGSSIPLTILAITATVIFTVSVVAVCKYRSKFKVHYDRAQLIEEGEGQEEEEDREDEGEEEEEEEEVEEEDEYDEVGVAVCVVKLTIHCVLLV